MQVLGFVKKINTKHGTNRNGRPYTLYSCRIQDKDGNELPMWYSLGFKAPPFTEGDYVKFDAIQKNERQAEVTPASIAISSKPPKAPAASPDSPMGGGAGNYNSDAARADRALHACRASAIELAGLLLANDALPMSGAKGKAGTAARFDEILEVVNKLTVQLFRQEIAEGYEDTFPILSEYAPEDKITEAVISLPEVAYEEGDGFSGSDDDDGFDDDIPF